MDKDLETLAPALVAALGGSWTWHADGYNPQAVKLVNDADYVLYIGEGSRLHPDQWHIASAVNFQSYEFRHRDEHFPVINVSQAKNPAQIAKEIERRVLPGLTELAQAVEKRRRNAQEYEDAGKRLALTLGPMLQNQAPYHQPGSDTYRVVVYWNKVRVEVEVEGPSAELHIDHLTETQVTALLQVINTFAKEGDNENTVSPLPSAPARS